MKDEVCQIFVDTLLGYRDRAIFRLHAFVLMPDHFHILLTPSIETALERSVQYIKGGSAHEIRERLGFKLPVWQRGFSDHRIRDSRDYEIHLRYIEQNPMKQKLIRDAADYPWSSALGRFELDEIPQRLKPLRGGGEAA